MVGNPNHDERGRFSSGIAGAKKGALIGAAGGAVLGSLKGAGMLLAKVHPATALGLGAGQAVLGAASWGATGAVVGGIAGLASHKKNVKAHIAKQHIDEAVAAHVKANPNKAPGAMYQIKNGQKVYRKPKGS